MIRWIRSHWEYVEFSKSRRIVRGKHFKVVLLPDAEGPALGITISKKVANAVGRNRLKRRMKAWFRDCVPLLAIKQKMSFIAQKGAAELSWQELSDELGELIKCVIQQG